MAPTAVTLAILGMALITFGLRLLPMLALSRARLPDWLQEWLGFVPGAVLAASLAQTLLFQDERLVASWRNPYLLAALPTVLVAWRTRSMVLTMLVGMVTFALLGRWLA